MAQNKKILNEIFKKLGEKCTSCGRFFISAAIEASTESGNYGVHLEGIGNYPLSCDKYPECAMECVLCSHLTMTLAEGLFYN